MKLNHRLWKLIYLLAIWAGMELGMTLHAHGEVTKPTGKPIVEYHWKVLQNYNNLMRMRQMLYGKRKAKKEAPKLLEIPEPQPSPSQADFPLQRRRRGNRRLRLQFALTSPETSSRLARSLWRQNPGRSYLASAKSPQSKRTLHRVVSALSTRGAT
jgi:hypothetical protein